MSTKLQEFIQKWNGRYLEIAGSPGAENQCVDLANAYIRDVLGLPIIEWTNAVDFPSKAGNRYDYILNTPDGIPLEGDLVVWGGQYGHIAIFLEGDTKRFNSFDQNFPIGSFCHVQEHNYDNPQVLGWLRPKNPPQDELTECLRQHTILVDEANKRDTEISQLKATQDNLNQIINDRNNNITTLNGQIETLKIQLESLQQQVSTLQPLALQVPDLKALLEQAINDKTNCLSAQENLNKSIAQKDRRLNELRENLPKLLLEYLIKKIKQIRG